MVVNGKMQSFPFGKGTTGRGDMASKNLRLLLFLVLFCSRIHLICSTTNPNDLTVLLALKAQWQDTPPNWGKSSDPCGLPWVGVTCDSNSRVTGLGLSSMNIKGPLPADIGGLTELTSLDLSLNKGLTGPIPSQLGSLQKLNILILANCSFTSSIPDELGNLTELTFLALNSNNFSSNVPASLGKLSKLYWLDVSENQLYGSLPVSTNTTPGLDLLFNCNHFHFSKNQLSGTIPAKLFSSNMSLIHILFDDNKFNGSIPSTVGLVQTLEALRLDRNSFSGNVPSTLNNITQLSELNLAYNELDGPLPNLTGMNFLSYIDLSNNSFVASAAPDWFSTLLSLTTLIIQYGLLQGIVPQNLFSLPQLEQVDMRNNAFNGTLYMGTSVSPNLELVNLEDNKIELLTTSPYQNRLMLKGTPACNNAPVLSILGYCKFQPKQAYSTPTYCGGASCPSEQKLKPRSCTCAVPYEGIITFRAPSFSDLSNATLFELLEVDLWRTLNLTNGSVSLQNILHNQSSGYLIVPVSFFPSNGTEFSRSDIVRIGFAMTNHTFTSPPIFGTYLFSANPYPFPAHEIRISIGVIVGIAISSSVLVLGLVWSAIYAIKQKKRAQRAMELSKPFASWIPRESDGGGAPQLKGARWFYFDEIKKCTNSFSESNEIGSGGYGRVYKGMLPDGQVLAIKRAQQGSMQGAHEFKTEIELLSRVHHKNLVGLVGFCYEQGEQMLVYEYMPNGTLRESLSGKTSIPLDWTRRLQVALGSAKGLAYLHELANPPIIHRDVKSTNILLDENLVAKVADFGLSKMVADSEKGHVSTQVKGTLGYLDPEYYMTQLLTDKSDVYSFGVVMLELITAKPPLNKGKYIVREVRMAMDKNDQDCYGLRQVMDPSLLNVGCLAGFTGFVELAMRCLEDLSMNRPRMNEVVKEIEVILQAEGIATSTTSAARDVRASHYGAPTHPFYTDVSLSSQNVSYSNSFDHSSGYALSMKIEPK
ncbi:probable leucine-rich repeat receptor-like protein kinase At5g49770 isoform X1 [Eucalyptus grandis]|uniref:probable leucine-rich repeat receptor-like protein kinase At5g49770 isoform X1 n=1 Tax=Eucalyptus grandis TaxID=71139 RepID=UPI00192ED024|nr:probable leucine-rich repeat receptor-like protein kinase At5g49770 isoform X1 [Eucalyptus grandis]